MSHFLSNKSSGGRMVGRPRAGVRVRFEPGKKALTLDPDPDAKSIYILKADTLVADLPNTFRVLDNKGKVVKASGQFAVTTETLDPYHVLVDLPNGW